jgi:hypothetical protein
MGGFEEMGDLAVSILSARYPGYKQTGAPIQSRPIPSGKLAGLDISAGACADESSGDGVTSFLGGGYLHDTLNVRAHKLLEEQPGDLGAYACVEQGSRGARLKLQLEAAPDQQHDHLMLRLRGGTELERERERERAREGNILRLRLSRTSSTEDGGPRAQSGGGGPSGNFSLCLKGGGIGTSAGVGGTGGLTRGAGQLSVENAGASGNGFSGRSGGSAPGSGCVSGAEGGRAGVGTGTGRIEIGAGRVLDGESWEVGALVREGPTLPDGRAGVAGEQRVVGRGAGVGTGGGRMTVGTVGMKPTPPIMGARKLARVVTRALDGGVPLRIAFLTWESLHTIAVGGVAPHVTELAAGLERRGHEVHVYSRTGDGQMPYEIIDGVHIHRVAIALDPDFITECRYSTSLYMPRHHRV